MVANTGSGVGEGKSREGHPQWVQCSRHSNTARYNRVSIPKADRSGELIAEKAHRSHNEAHLQRVDKGKVADNVYRGLLPSCDKHPHTCLNFRALPPPELS